MRRRLAILLGAGVAILAGCGEREPDPSFRVDVAAAPYQEASAVSEEIVIELSGDAVATLDRLHTLIETNSLRQFSRFAESQPGFVSNFAGAPHREHWDLLRRTGFDPLLELETLLERPYGVTGIAGETWYVWPDFAAWPREALDPGRLSPHERARLQELIGVAGIEALENGHDYPGIRTAISETGRWLYYVHEDMTGDDNG